MYVFTNLRFELCGHIGLLSLNVRQHDVGLQGVNRTTLTRVLVVKVLGKVWSRVWVVALSGAPPPSLGVGMFGLRLIHN